MMGEVVYLAKFPIQDLRRLYEDGESKGIFIRSEYTRLGRDSVAFAIYDHLAKPVFVLQSNGVAFTLRYRGKVLYHGPRFEEIMSRLFFKYMQIEAISARRHRVGADHHLSAHE